VEQIAYGDVMTKKEKDTSPPQSLMGETTPLATTEGTSVVASGSPRPRCSPNLFVEK